MRILLVEDDKNLSRFLQIQLTAEHFEVDVCGNGEDALYFILQRTHDFILLDRMLPGKDGVSVLREIRRQGIEIPVIFITALGTLDDKLTGLDYGADDYLVKPFDFEELIARIRCITRRPKELSVSQELSFPPLIYKIEEKKLIGPCGTTTLSKREGNLLEAFLRSPNQILPRATLMIKVWGTDVDVEDGNLDNYIHFLRRKLKLAGGGCVIRTVRGTGYRLEVEHVS